MRCETCHGIGDLLVDIAMQPVTRLRDAAMMIPCPACCGTGIASCCDGAIGGPEEETNKGEP